jgi:hypothetical protein
MRFSGTFLYACLAFPAMGLPVWAQAGAAEPSTVFSITDPVEIPGVVLKPGVYRLKLKRAAPQQNIVQLVNVVQVLDESDQSLVATLYSTPDYDVPASDTPVFTYHPRPAGWAKAIQTWFPPEESHGQQFFYSKSQAAELAKTSKRGVLTLPEASTWDAPVGEASRQDSATDELPQTASYLPWLAWVSVFSLAGFFTLRFLQPRRAAAAADGNQWFYGRAFSMRIAAAAYQNYKLSRLLAR